MSGGKSVPKNKKPTEENHFNLESSAKPSSMTVVTTLGKKPDELKVTFPKA